MKLLTMTVISVVLIASILALRAYGASGPIQVAPKSAVPDYILVQDRTWEKAQWTGDNRPFADARRAIDKIASAGADLGQLVDSYKAGANAAPSDPLKQFRWAYACQKWANIPHSTMRDSAPVLTALIKANQPNTYDYARIRLMSMYSGPQDRALYKRLLDYEPNDPQLESMYAYVLSESKSKSDDDKAIQIEENLIAKHRFMPTVYRDLADIYYDVGWNEQIISYYQKSVENSKIFLSLTSTSDWRRAATEHSIEYLTKRLAENKL